MIMVGLVFGVIAEALGFLLGIFIRDLYYPLSFFGFGFTVGVGATILAIATGRIQKPKLEVNMNHE